MEQDIRLVYVAASNQVRVQFPAELVLEERKPPKDLYKRAKAKLEDELGKGNIESYVVYESSFLQFWTWLRKQGELAQKELVFCIAQGFRNYKDIQLKQDTEQRAFSLSIHATAEALGKIGWSRFQAYLQKQMGIEPYSSPLILMRMRECYWRAMRGEKIQARLLNWAALEQEDELPPVKFSLDKANGSLVLWINSAELIQSSGHKKLLAHLQTFLEKNKAALAGYGALPRECTELLKELSVMPESLGFGLPVGLPVAVKAVSSGTFTAPISQASLAKKRSLPTPTQKEAPQAQRSPGKAGESKASDAGGLIGFEVSKDRLEAYISWVNEAKLEAGPYDSDKRWLEKALHDAGIVYGYETLLDRLIDRVALGQSIKNELVARGLPPIPGQRTYMHPLYLEKTFDDSSKVINLRSAQNKRVVETGDVIAEIRYLDGKAGMDVYGRPVHASVLQTSYKVEAGSGVERREDGRFYALLRGMPKLEHNMVSCLTVYVHPGDVNLKSGDILFDGNVEVQGNIDNGARVITKGDLIVRGGIGRARIQCGGDLSVSGGIISSREGIIHALGNVSALFIENSRLLVEGTLEVEQSIMNSDCKVAGEVIVKNSSKGLIGGGTIVSETGIRTLNLGFADGEKTICRVGSDWRLEHRISILQARGGKIKRFIFDRQYELDELIKKRIAGERLAKLENRLSKGKKLLEKIDKLADQARSKIRWNDMAILIVRGVVEANVEVSIGGRVVPVAKSLREVMFTAVRYRDQFVNSLDYLEQYKKNRLTGSNAG